MPLLPALALGAGCWRTGQPGDEAPASDSDADGDADGDSDGDSDEPVLSPVAAGYRHTCGLRPGGEILCWGANSLGQLGNGHTGAFQPFPTEVVGLDAEPTSVFAGGDDTCATTSAGGLACWGDDWYGQLGNGTATDGESSTLPVTVIGPGTEVVSCDVGGTHGCAATAGGDVTCWGSNDHGQLGDGTQEDSSGPVTVAGLPDAATAVAAGGDFSCALTSAGRVLCWGGNEHGQLGDGTTAPSPAPVEVIGLWDDVSAISAGGAHACALSAGGGVRCWGESTFGQLGCEGPLGPDYHSAVPVDVVGLQSGVVTVSAGGAHTCALTAAGGAKCWGNDESGQLGDGDVTPWVTYSLTPVDVVGLGSGVVSLVAGGAHACAILDSGTMRCWGEGGFGQLGNGSTADSSTPVGVADF
jgi:alpha-tubulin suppressor-like RCC1 family protein